MAKELKIAFGGATSAGAKPLNEDAFAVFQPPTHVREIKGAAACVADGVSSSEHARVASETSVTTFIQDYFSTPDTWDVKTSAARVLSALNSWLNYQGQVALSRHNSMVTTFSSVILKSTTAHILHTGDCRVYRLRDRELVQLTRDHNLIEHNGNKVLTGALGMDSQLKVDYQKRSIRVDDIFLITSDGVHDFLDDEIISSQLLTLVDNPATNGSEGQNSALESLSEHLIQLALDNKSNDNITCLIIRVVNLPLEDIDEAHRQLTRLAIPPALEPGVLLDEYRITRVLHEGARSHIYLAEHDRFKTPFVIKVPSENFADDPSYLEGFVREQWVGRRINDPLVMKILDPNPDSRFLYHVCEYVPGITLRQWIYDNPQPDFATVRRLAGQLIAALRIFQRMRMLHRDLKPENVMVLPDGSIKLIDFGTVKVPGLDEITSPIRDDTPVGSVDYIAPEYLMGDLGLYRSDLFSLGVIIYEMLTGELPYKTLLRKDGRVKSYDEWQYIPAQTIRKDIPLWLDLALKKACTPRPTERYQAMSEFLQDMSSPNQALIDKHTSAPLMEKDPLKFWQGLSILLIILLLLQLAWPNL